MKFIKPLEEKGDIKFPADLFFYFLLQLACLLAPKIKPSAVISQRFWFAWASCPPPPNRGFCCKLVAERARWWISCTSTGCYHQANGHDSSSRSSRQSCGPWGPPVWAGTGRARGMLQAGITGSYHLQSVTVTTNQQQTQQQQRREKEKKAFGKCF